MLKAMVQLVVLGAMSLQLIAQADGQQQPTCAILTFDAVGGLSADEARILSDRFAIEFDRIGRYQMLSRSKMGEVLAEHELSESCLTATCAMERGRILTMQYLVYGSIGRIGHTYTINSFLIDVETGAQIRSATSDHRGTIDDVLTYLMSANAQQLLEIETPPMPAPQPRDDPWPPRDSEESSPARADVRVNNQTLRPGSVPVKPKRTLTIALDPLSLLVSPDADGFFVTGRTGRMHITERIEGAASFTPMLKAGVRLRSRPIVQDVFIGGGVLVNDAFYAPFGTLESRTHFRLGRLFLLGPKIGLVVIGEPTWEGVSDVSLSSAAGVDIGLAVSIDTRRVTFGVSLSYMALAPMDVETGSGWVASDDELELSGPAIQLGVRFLL